MRLVNDVKMTNQLTGTKSTGKHNKVYENTMTRNAKITKINDTL
jgi:hypothetical protein